MKIPQNLLAVSYLQISNSDVPPINANEGNKNLLNITVKQPKAESGLSKQLLNNFQAENSCDCKQLEAEVKNRVAYKKNV